MKNLEANYEKNIGTTSKTAATTILMMLVSVTIVSLFLLSIIIIPDTAPQLAIAEEAQLSVNSMEEIKV
jgi:competence protein ComGC